MAKILVAGQIIKELSKSIPTAQLALIELIKNAYEAGANTSTIKVSNDEIIIKDDGLGMSLKDINTLLNISHSEKIFGSKIDGRYVSGEKGLGFFSVFKFGSFINVKTIDSQRSNFIYYFNLDLKKLVQQSDVSSFEVPINHTPSNDFKGTEIKITGLDSDSIHHLREALNKNGESSRLSNVINDPGFKINIFLDGIKTADNTNENQKFQKAKIATIQYLSKRNNEIIPFVKLNVQGIEQDLRLPDEFVQFLKTPGLTLAINLSVYSLKGTKKEDAPSIYYFEDKRKISPLTYINDSLFENSHLYNLEVNAAGKNKNVFRQQIGKILLYLNEPDIIKFNSDRTQIIESYNYTMLKEITKFISSNTQKQIREILDSEKNVNNQSESNDNSPWQQSSIFEDDPKQSIKQTVQNDDPTITQLVKEIIVLKEYKFEELFEFKDAKGHDAIKPSRPVFEPSNAVCVNTKNNTVTFSRTGTINFSITITDKTTNKEKIINTQLKIISKYKSLQNISDDWIIPFNETEPASIDHSIINFKKNINSIKSMNRFDDVLVSSLRTFVELIIKKIAEYIGIETENKLLSKLYSEVIDWPKVEDNFIKNIKDLRTQKAYKTVYNEYFLYEKDTSLIDFLNLTTHTATQIVSLASVDRKLPFFNFLYTYLVVVTSAHSQFK
ncbi:ATP-binding protein [Xylocopilactobacillus apis]|uniref:Histidine kinase-, DNA gyrase B-, and HSP90-like ATPase n=1 Tax=Xylocopilactobacillus apis TaxID=2932183 RepID=A0AAU9DGN6_9LACO|nr:ATP-binding protein [Xylocopilactobacillus apis]BDR57436.1 hypothetical protein KIMC2_19980 [Xylocopilactobacillus apis]